MSATIDITEGTALTVLRAFLIGILPTGVDVIKAQVNRVPQPAGPDFVLMTPLMLERLATNEAAYSDGFPDDPQVRRVKQSTRFTVQLDVHGPNALAYTQMVTTLFRDEEAAAQFEATGFAIAPLYTSEPRQVPFTNAEQQVETRWTVDLAMQIKPVITMGQDFADALAVGLFEVQTTYPETDDLVANFTFVATGATSVTFTSTSTGGPESFAWDFRSLGATNSTAPIATYDYGAIGVYVATLTVTRGPLTRSITRTVFLGHLPSLATESGGGILTETGSFILLET